MSEFFQHKKVDISILTPNLDGAPEQNPFYNKKVVFTGDLDGWDRPSAASVLQRLGADVNTSISKRTDIVIVGKGAGPKKLETIIDLMADGCMVRLLNERLFVKEIEPYKEFLNIS
jgi:DNA polymerase-3 subunit epsilon